MKYLYYPGCSLKSTGRAYEESILTVFKSLDISLTEIEDWNCCGATAYMAVDECKAFAIAARNLALAEKQFKDEPEVHIVAPCSACFMVLMKTISYMNTHKEIGQNIRKALNDAGLKFENRVKIRHPLDVLVNDFGIDKLTRAINNPLKGLRVASYYGCQTVRPFESFDTNRNPMTMDKIVQALGGQPVDWSLKTRCCGASLTGTIPEVGLRLSYIILHEAQQHHADVVVTSCPLCQFNLECYQSKMTSAFGHKIEIPVMFFSQLMGMALGLPESELGVKRLFVKPTFKSKSGQGGKPVYV